MELFYAPMACSMVPRIVAHELGLPLTTHQVETYAKTLTADGSAYAAVSSLELVPVLRFPDGESLTEVIAIVHALVDASDEPGRMLGAPGSRERHRIVSWMSYGASELHKRSLWPRANPNSPPAMRRYAKTLSEGTFDHLEAHLEGREYIASEFFSAADAYLAWALNVAPLIGMPMGERPRLDAYRQRLSQRPSVARLLAEEQAQLEQALARQAHLLPGR